VANLALPVYYHRYHRGTFLPVYHLLRRCSALARSASPCTSLVKPGQPTPFNHYPLIALGVVVVALIYGAVVFSCDRTLGERVGSIVADAE
jgi:hypothetical protein